jgi:bifunctional non-homologous end joining protein LigD
MLRSKSRRQYVPQSDAAIIAAEAAGALPGKHPGFIKPMLAKPTDKLPSGDKWVHEIKLDGYRLQIHKRGHDVRCFTREGHDWTERFSSLVVPAWTLEAREFVLDGEVTVQDEKGRPDFGRLQRDLANKITSRLVYFAFDILYIDGHDLRLAPLIDRKAVLAELLSAQKKGSPIVLSEHTAGNGEATWRDLCKLGLEGVVSKRVDGKYQPGERGGLWLKRACAHRDTFIVAGIAYDNGKFDGLYLGRKERKTFVYAGKIELGFKSGYAKLIEARAAKLKATAPPFDAKARKSWGKETFWLKPTLSVETEYRGVDDQGKLRHPIFKRLRSRLRQ